MFPLVCYTAEELDSAVPELLGVVEFALAMKGFCQDLSCGKTEVIFVPRGPGKPRAMATVAHDDGAYFALRDRRLSVVKDYVHMRAVVTASTAITKTVRRPLQTANGTCASLDTPIFAPRAITAKVKLGSSTKHSQRDGVLGCSFLGPAVTGLLAAVELISGQICETSHQCPASGGRHHRRANP